MLFSLLLFQDLTPWALLSVMGSGECAGHFRQILQKFPPQVATRSTAAAWACHVHNEVNKSLKKELFDCSKIGDFYDCGCAEDERKGSTDKTAKIEDEKAPGKSRVIDGGSVTSKLELHQEG